MRLRFFYDARAGVGHLAQNGNKRQKLCKQFQQHAWLVVRQHGQLQVSLHGHLHGW